jgi:hypothetical protein
MEQRDITAWIVRPFTLEEILIEAMDVKSNAEVLCLPKKNKFPWP